jgi:hypothetical protein
MAWRFRGIFSQLHEGIFSQSARSFNNGIIPIALKLRTFFKAALKLTHKVAHLHIDQHPESLISLFILTQKDLPRHQFLFTAEISLSSFPSALFA